MPIEKENQIFGFRGDLYWYPKFWYRYRLHKGKNRPPWYRYQFSGVSIPQCLARNPQPHFKTKLHSLSFPPLPKLTAKTLTQILSHLLTAQTTDTHHHNSTSHPSSLSASLPPKHQNPLSTETSIAEITHPLLSLLCRTTITRHHQNRSPKPLFSLGFTHPKPYPSSSLSTVSSPNRENPKQCSITRFLESNDQKEFEIGGLLVRNHRGFLQIQRWDHSKRGNPDFLSPMYSWRLLFSPSSQPNPIENKVRAWLGRSLTWTLEKSGFTLFSWCWAVKFVVCLLWKSVGSTLNQVGKLISARVLWCWVDVICFSALNFYS